MTVYGGFDPGTFQAWSLNLFSDIFTTPGIARGFQVTQTSTPSMAVVANLNGSTADAVCFISNGCWLRIDAQQTFSIGANNSGSTRTDALIAQVDPTNSANLSLAVQANWPSGFTAGSGNQLVLALISVANGAASITNANITMTSAIAQVTGAGGSTSAMTASDGVGLSVQDNSSSSTLSVVLTGLTTGVGRSILIQTTDASSIGHVSTFDRSGNLLIPGFLRTTVPGNGNNELTVLDIPITGTPTVSNAWQLRYDGFSGNMYFYDVTHGRFVQGWSQASAVPFGPNGGALAQMRSSGGTGGNDIFVGVTDPGASAGEGDLWVDG